MPEFKDMLKYYREHANLSQREFAKRIGIAPATVGMYEQGNRHPDFETEEKIADFFNVSLDNLRGRDTEAAPQLRSDEQQLLDGYNQLDQEDKAEVRGVVKGMLRNEKYIEQYREKNA